MRLETDPPRKSWEGVPPSAGDAGELRTSGPERKYYQNARHALDPERPKYTPNSFHVRAAADVDTLEQRLALAQERNEALEAGLRERSEILHELRSETPSAMFCEGPWEQCTFEPCVSDRALLKTAEEGGGG